MTKPILIISALLMCQSAVAHEPSGIRPIPLDKAACLSQEKVGARWFPGNGVVPAFCYVAMFKPDGTTLTEMEYREMFR